MKNSEITEQVVTDRIRKREPAEYTLLIFYKPLFAKKNSRTSSTHRHDVTIVQYRDKRNMDVNHLHPLFVLTLKLLEEKYKVASAVLYDNKRVEGHQIVCKFAFDGNGAETTYGDERRYYYDLDTGEPLTDK